MLGALAFPELPFVMIRWSIATGIMHITSATAAAQAQARASTVVGVISFRSATVAFSASLPTRWRGVGSLQRPTAAARAPGPSYRWRRAPAVFMKTEPPRRGKESLSERASRVYASLESGQQLYIQVVYIFLVVSASIVAAARMLQLLRYLDLL